MLVHEPYPPGGGRRERGRVQQAAPDGFKRQQLLGDQDVLLSQLLWTRRTRMCFRVGHFAQRCCGDLHYPALRLNALGMDLACHRRRKGVAGGGTCYAYPWCRCRRAPRVSSASLSDVHGGHEQLARLL